MSERNDNRIKVGVRIRPLSQRELAEGAATTVNAESGSRIVTSSADNKKNNYGFDWTFDSNASQRSVYDDMCRPLIDKVFEGYNATFFAYGQTGAGKTYTMGTTSDFQHGVVPYCINDIFAKRAALIKEGAQISVDLSYLEIYMEDCFDLLSKEGERKKLELRETQSGETFLDGLSAWPVATLPEVAHFLSEAAKVRATGRTAMNAVSSRSHAICTLTIRVFRDDVALVSKLNLVDLAGSERAKKTQATGDAFQEGVSINKGLLALGNVVSALSTKSRGDAKAGHVHVPYRESRLTRLLKDSLGGNGMTALLACISPANVNFEETVNTLRFASRASCIVNRAEVNHDSHTQDPAVLLREMAQLRSQLLSLQEKCDSAAKGEEARTRRRQQSTDSAADALAEDVVLHLVTSLKLASALKSILMQCLTEDLVVDDSLVLSVQSELQDLRASLGYEFSTEAGLRDGAALSQSLLLELSIDGLVIEDENIPPIMSTIEELSQLEAHLQGLLRKASRIDAQPGQQIARRAHAHARALALAAAAGEADPLGDLDEDLGNLSAISDELDTSGHSLDMSGNPGLGLGLGLDSEPSNEEIEATKDIAAKEEKIFSIVAITEQYKVTIKELSDEIAALEREREALVAVNGDCDGAGRKKENAASAVTHDTLKFKQELKAKTRLLEEKIKTLRSKEIEFNKICRVKERLVKELDGMQSKVQEYKRKKVDMMKRMREETVAHKEESKQLKFSEMQSKRRVQRAEIELQRVEQKLSNQEKFWRLKLEAKENECSRLRQLMKRQEENRVIKERAKRPAGALGGSSGALSGALGSGGGALGGNLFNSNQLTGSNTSGKQLQQLFRDEMRSQQDMARAHGQLSYEFDARRQLQQRKFAKKATLKRLRPHSPRHRALEEEVAGLERDIAARNKKIGHLQLQLQEQQELSANAQGSAMHRLAFLSKDASFNAVDLQACLQKLWVLHFEQMKENSKLALKVDDMQQALMTQQKEDEQVLPDDERQSDVADDTFYPSDEDSEASFRSDSEEEEAPKPKKRGRNPTKARLVEQAADGDEEDGVSSKRSRPSTESALSTSLSSDDPDQPSADQTKKRKTDAGAKKKTIAEADLEAIKSSKWFAMTIKDLKVQLAQRALPVSGVKNELVLRLLTYEQTHPQAPEAAAEVGAEVSVASPQSPREVLDHWVEVTTVEKQKPAPPAPISVPSENDENAPVDLNVLSPPKPNWRKGLELGKQLLSPLRALAADLNAEKAAGWGREQQVLSKDEELMAFRSRFLANKF